MQLLLPIILFVLGAILIALSSVITENTKNLAVESDVARANQGIYTMAIIFMTIAVTLLAFDVDMNASETVSLAFIVLLGIVLMVLAAIIVNKTSDKAKNAAVGILVMGIVFIVAGVSAIVVEKKDAIKAMRLPGKFRCY